MWSQPTDHEKDCYFCLSVIKPGRAKNEYYSSKKPRLSEAPNKEKNNEIKKSLSKDDLCNLPGCSSVKVFTSDTENKTSTSDISSNDEEVLQVCEETEDVTPESSIASSDEDILQIISLSNNQTQDVSFSLSKAVVNIFHSLCHFTLPLKKGKGKDGGAKK